jgi:hypothetical protein
MFCPGCGVQLDPGANACSCGWCSLPNLGDNAAIRMLLPVGRSLWAIAAGYLGLLSLVILPAPLALLFGIVAILDIRKHPERHGMGRAIFGIVMGSLGTLALVFAIIGMMVK